MSEATEPLTEAQIGELSTQLDRFLSSLTFGEAVRGNRYVESEDADYFEQGIDNEYDAYDLLRQFPALIRDWRAMKELVYMPKILPGDEPLTYRDYSKALLRQKVEAQNEIRGVLEALGADAIHSHPDGGAEDIYESLAISVAKLQSQNAALREQLAESERLLAQATQRMMRININYRQASGLPMRLQAYCMRSEAAVGIGVLSEEEWQTDLNSIEAGKPYPDTEEQP